MSTTSVALATWRHACAAALSIVIIATVAGCTSPDDGPGRADEPDVSSARPTSATGPLSILLVNDDGWDAPGITALYDKLVEDGNTVTLVAPLKNQSGKSMATSSGPLTVSRPEGDVPKYAVDGTPVDSLNIGLLGLLKDSPPDLVVSGINTGANVAGNTSYSGTVGAAAAAAELGFPAIAVSADVGGPSSDGDYVDGAETVADLATVLARTGFAGLGTQGFINVNVPFETSGRRSPRGLRVVPAADRPPRTVSYDESSPGTWTQTPAYDGRVGAASADASQLADGWTTLTFLPVARVADRAGQARLRTLVRDLR